MHAQLSGYLGNQILEGISIYSKQTNEYNLLYISFSNTLLRIGSSEIGL